jgi:hypothetical protein
MIRIKLQIICMWLMLYVTYVKVIAENTTDKK